MPHSKSASKRLRQAEARKGRNRSAKSKVKTLTRRLHDAEGDAAPGLLKDVQSTLDKAAAKGVIHKNAARRRKSRLAKAATKAS